MPAHRTVCVLSYVVFDKVPEALDSPFPALLESLELHDIHPMNSIPSHYWHDIHPMLMFDPLPHDI